MGTVVAVLGVLAVLFAAASVATREGPVLADAPPDRADLELPSAGPVCADDLERLRFGLALRGYRMSEVDEVLDRVAAELRERDDRLERLQAELSRVRGGAGRDDAEAELSRVRGGAGRDDAEAELSRVRGGAGRDDAELSHGPGAGPPRPSAP